MNGVNPDAVVRGSGIFASGWGAERVAIYGVEEEDLGEFYARRTLLGRESPEHVAAAVFTLRLGRSPGPPGLTYLSTVAWLLPSSAEPGQSPPDEIGVVSILGERSRPRFRRGLP